MVTKYGQVFEMKRTFKKNFSWELFTPNSAAASGFPDEIEAVSFNFVNHLVLNGNYFAVQLQIQTLKSLLILLYQSAGNRTQYMLFDNIGGVQTQCYIQIAIEDIVMRSDVKVFELIFQNQTII